MHVVQILLRKRIVFCLLLLASLLLAASPALMAQSTPSPTQPTANAGSGVTYRTMAVNGQTVFYREAGQERPTTLLFLHGFPSSSRMWQPLLEELATDYHVIAPDYIGFGHSSQPPADQFAYTFENLTNYVDTFISQLGLSRFTLVVQDYGGPIGMRLAERHPDKIQALIIQNAVSHQEGLSPLWETRKAFWAHKEQYYEAVKKNFVSFDATRQRHLGTTPTPERIDPDTYTDEYRFLNQPGMAAIQLDLFYDYQTNVQAYPQWQAWLRKQQPKLLVIWGKYDPSFTVAGAWKYQEDVPTAEVHVVAAGHFALDEAREEILVLMQQFLQRLAPLK